LFATCYNTLVFAFWTELIKNNILCDLAALREALKIRIKKEMKINRQNYEHWFIDFIEGNLTPDDEAMVREFAQSNPDLKNELEDILVFNVAPEQTNFPDKNLLKQNKLNAIDGITKFEQLCIAHLENDINELEQKELESLLFNSDKKKKEFQLIQNIKLAADNNIKYSSKNALKKLFIVKTKTINDKLIYRVAAALILLFGLSFLFNQNSETEFTAKQFSQIQNMPGHKRTAKIRNTDILKFNKHMASVVSQNKAEKKEIRQTEILANKLVAIECYAINYEINYRDSTRLKEHIYNNIYTLNNKTEKRKISFNKIRFQLVKSAGELVVADLLKLFKRNFKYKKIYTNDGRILLAFKAGDLEYQVSKKQKNLSSKNK